MQLADVPRFDSARTFPSGVRTAGQGTEYSSVCIVVGRSSGGSAPGDEVSAAACAPEASYGVRT